MKKIGILYGGRSGEHEVSLCSAASVVKAINRKKYEPVAIGIDTAGRWHVQDSPVIVDDPDFGTVLALEQTGDWRLNHFESGGRLVLTEVKSGRTVSVDAVFPAVHGTFCEDGTLQGLLELAMVPFVGADTAGSAVGMDKDIAKRLLRDAGIPVVEWVTLTKSAWLSDRKGSLAEAMSIPMPLFIKPCRAGSSVGVKKAVSAEDVASAIDFAFQYDTKILIERGIDAREIECSVLGNDKPESSIPGEIIPRHDFYSYEAKYIDPEGADLKIPADVSDELAAAISRTAVKGYKALCCAGMARVDFFLEKGSDKFYLNEVNTLPGFTSISMYPKLWEACGLGYSELIDRLIYLAFERYNEKKQIKTER